MRVRRVTPNRPPVLSFVREWAMLELIKFDWHIPLLGAALHPSRGDKRDPSIERQMIRSEPVAGVALPDHPATD